MNYYNIIAFLAGLGVGLIAITFIIRYYTTTMEKMREYTISKVREAFDKAEKIYRPVVNELADELDASRIALCQMCGRYKTEHGCEGCNGWKASGKRKKEDTDGEE